MDKYQISSGPTYSIRIFRTGQCRVKGQYAYRTYAKDREHTFTIYIGILQGHGITALIDTGVESVDEMNRGAGFLLSELITQQPSETTASILKAANINPSQVNYVFLTHCHYDHCSQLPLFPNAHIVIPEHAWHTWHHQENGAVYLHAGFLQHLEHLHDKQLLVLSDEGLILPGIGVRWVGGHSPCSQFIYANTGKGVAVFTGDTVQMYGNLEQNDPIGIWVNDEQCWNALNIARTTADFIIPGHDPRVLKIYPEGLIA